MLNPTCSEVVYRLGKRKYIVDTSGVKEGDIERFVERLARARKLDFSIVSSSGGSTDFIGWLARLRETMGREEFYAFGKSLAYSYQGDEGLDPEVLVKRGEEIILIGRPFELERALEEGYRILAFVEKEKAKKIRELMRSGRNLRAEILALLL